jgi:hypothetical protein
MDGVSRMILGQHAEAVRPDEILLKRTLLILVIAGVVRVISISTLVPVRISPSPWWPLAGAMPLVTEGAAAAVVLLASGLVFRCSSFWSTSATWVVRWSSAFSPAAPER